MMYSSIPEPLRSILSTAYWRYKARRTDSTRTIRLESDTYNLHTDTPSECKIITNTVNTENKILQDFADRIRESDVVYDVGANIGQYTCLAASKGATTLAFDPHPANAERIRDNIGLNGAEANVIEAALSDEDGMSPFAFSVEEAGSDQGELSDNNGRNVRTYRGDTYARDTGPPPTVAKIDVEGFEIEVLEGFGDVLGDCRLIYVERHFNKLNQPDQVIDLLRESGFSTEIILERDGQDMVRGVQSYAYSTGRFTALTSARK